MEFFGYILNITAVEQMIQHPIVQSCGGYFSCVPGGMKKSANTVTLMIDPGQAVKLPIGLVRVAIGYPWAKQITEAEFDALVTPQNMPVPAEDAQQAEEMTRRELDEVAAGLHIDTSKMRSKAEVLKAIDESTSATTEEQAAE